MNRTVRGALSAWMVLIILQTVGSRGSGRVAAAFNDVNALTQRALSADVPAIPDRRTAGAGAAVSTTRAGQLPLAETFNQYSSGRVPTLGRNVPQ